MKDQRVRSQIAMPCGWIPQYPRGCAGLPSGFFFSWVFSDEFVQEKDYKDSADKKNYGSNNCCIIERFLHKPECCRMNWKGRNGIYAAESTLIIIKILQLESSCGRVELHCVMNRQVAGNSWNSVNVSLKTFYSSFKRIVWLWRLLEKVRPRLL